jgi:hypothetical protein
MSLALIDVRYALACRDLKKLSIALKRHDKLKHIGHHSTFQREFFRMPSQLI